MGALWAAVNGSKYPEKIRIIACRTDFEGALFDQKISKDKPYNAIVKMRSDESFKTKIKELFDALLDGNKQPPANCIRWGKIEDLM